MILVGCSHMLQVTTRYYDIQLNVALGVGRNISADSTTFAYHVISELDCLFRQFLDIRVCLPKYWPNTIGAKVAGQQPMMLKYTQSHLPKFDHAPISSSVVHFIPGKLHSNH